MKLAFLETGFLPYVNSVSLGISRFDAYIDFYLAFSPSNAHTMVHMGRSFKMTHDTCGH